MKKIKTKLNVQKPLQVYKSSQSQDASSQVRNKKQCSNFKYAINKQKRFGHDEIINIHMMHVALDFPNQCMTFPELRIISFDSELVKQAIILLKSHPRLINFQYDTTFCLTGYYVSTLSFVHPMLLNFKGVHPGIVLGYFYHEKKTSESHDDFWR